MMKIAVPVFLILALFAMSQAAPSLALPGTVQVANVQPRGYCNLSNCLSQCYRRGFRWGWCDFFNTCHCS
uniref:Defensin TY 2 n=1 Tax=Tabanus yao TaxID=485572 RepID=C1IBY6_TABYA|nr:defensin TY 2 [Tabanus yao]